MAEHFLQNPGFELGPEFWTVSSDYAVIEDGSNARSGSWVCRLIGADVSREMRSTLFAVRPGGKIVVSAWMKGGTVGTGQCRVVWFDVDRVAISANNGSSVAAGGGYTESAGSFIAPSRSKFVSVGFIHNTDGGSLTGTWYTDDVTASGDIIEELPESAHIQSKRMIGAETIAVFDPLIGDDKFSSFNAGMSDRWAGVYNFIPQQNGRNLSDLLAFHRRLGRKDRFFAFDPDGPVPLNGVVNGMLVDGAVTAGVTRIPVKNAPAGSTPLSQHDYVEIGSQYFVVQQPLRVGPEGTGYLIVWPSVRSTIANEEEIITDRPKMVARITTPTDWEHPADDFVRYSFSWQEV